MRRMTISRSNISLAVVLIVAAGGAPAVHSQDRPATHTVRRGDTLWDLARQYLGDPFLWPQIFRLNTDVVEDPHWIYPGEVLRLVAEGAPPAVPEAPRETPPVQEPAPVAAPQTPTPAAGDPPPLFPRRTVADLGSALVTYRDRTYRALRPGEFYSSGFMSEGDMLPLGAFMGNAVPSQIQVVTNRSTTQLNDLVAVIPPAGASYRVGDSLLVVQLGQRAPGHPEWGNVVKPTGMLKITAVQGDRYLGKMLAQYYQVFNDQYVLPIEPFVSSGEYRAQPVTNGVSGSVILSRDGSPLLAPQQVLFLDVGREAGVVRGDIFEIRRDPSVSLTGRETDDVMAVLQIVHVRAKTATARVLNVMSPDIKVPVTAVQVARLPN